MGFINVSKIDWTDYGVNTYLGCEHKCIYCYSRRFLKRFGRQVSDDPRPRDFDPYAVKMEALKIPRYRKIMVNTLSDPYPRVEMHYRHTRKFLESVLPTGRMILILTKSPLVVNDLDLLRRFENGKVGFSITGLNDSEVRKWEPYAPPVSERIEALKKVKAEGVSTFVSIEPWLPCTRPAEIIRELRRYVDWWIIGRLNHQVRFPELGLYGLSDDEYRAMWPDVKRELLNTGKPFVIKRELRKTLETAMSEP